ncbi:uncharacterized protein LOC134812504 [Bolinopsis microptera]|uniref:uncharacterized protein LOC134812504 n=1 Tax=Bolinopsis microptera TaxID=2820187 RepID=UPI00307A976B
MEKPPYHKNTPQGGQMEDLNRFICFLLCTNFQLHGTITEEKGSVKCKQCERGTHRSTDNSEPVCEPCQPGFFSGQLGLAECEPCPTGTYSNGQAIECDKCEKGKFQSETGQETCELCPPGSFSDEEGLSECTPCKVDTVASEGGSTSCVACSYGFYSPQEAGKKCLACPKRAAYQPPSCPPIIPNCPAQQFTNQYGTFKFPEMEPPGDGSGKAHEQKCEFALYVNDEKVFSNITSECQTWFESGVQKSEWTTPSYAKCGTVKTEILYNQTKAAREAIKEAESSGKSAAEATVDPSVATSMLSGLMGALGTPAPDPTKPDPDPTNPNNSTNPDQTDAKENEKEEGGLGAADTASVVNTLSVVANSVPPEVLANPENQKNILGAINSFAEQDGDFVQDAGTETASAAVNVVNSIGASMFAAVEEPETPTDPSSGGDGENGGTKPKKKKMKEIKTDTMTILPTPMTEETLSKSVILDFGNDEEEEEEETELDDAISDGAKNEEPAEQELPATEAPVIPDPVQSEGEEPAPTAAPALSIVRATKPPPVKKIVMVEMPPLSNLVTASGGENSDAKGLVCVVFETPALFPTKKVADNSTSTKKPKKGVVEPKVVSKVVLLTFGSKSISNINPPLALNFTKDEPEDYDPVTQDVQYKCVYYHKETNSWKSDGCTTTSVDKTRGGQVSCSCNHMTSFAILMSLEPIPDYLEVIQSQITTPLLAFSLFCLLVMIGTILPFKQLRSTRSMKIHLSLAGSQCFAIIIFLLTNLDGIVSENVPIVCKGIAIMMDYTYLVVFMWTLVESVIMYISLVQVFGGHISKYMLKFNLFCWITPLLSPLTDYFLTEGILLEDGKCVVDLGVRKWSFILPIAVILGINFFIFVTLLRVIANTKNPDKSKTENTMKQLKAVASISCMLGLGWILGFFMVGPIAPYFQFAFILINGLQGLFMFLFYCVGNEQYMDLWKSKFGLKTSKSNSNSNSAAAGRKSVATTASNVRPSTVQASSSVVPATPAPAPAAAKPAPPSASLNPGAAPRANRRTSRAQAQAKIEEEAKKLEHQDSIGSAIYENENVYDIIDDPEIKAMSPASGSATITRL